jgi:hypothetical protein
VQGPKEKREGEGIAEEYQGRVEYGDEEEDYKVKKEDVQVIHKRMVWFQK